MSDWIRVIKREVTPSDIKDGIATIHDDYILDFRMPDVDTAVLVTQRTRAGLAVFEDIVCEFDGYYLDSGADWDDVVAWTPLPESFDKNEEGWTKVELDGEGNIAHDVVLDSKIIVSLNNGEVHLDVCYNDGTLDSGHEWSEVKAWQFAPQPCEEE